MYLYLCNIHDQRTKYLDVNQEKIRKWCKWKRRELIAAGCGIAGLILACIIAIPPVTSYYNNALTTVAITNTNQTTFTDSSQSTLTFGNFEFQYATNWDGTVVKTKENNNYVVELQNLSVDSISYINTNGYKVEVNNIELDDGYVTYPTSYGSNVVKNAPATINFTYNGVTYTLDDATISINRKQKVTLETNTVSVDNSNLIDANFVSDSEVSVDLSNLELTLFSMDITVGEVDMVTVYPAGKTLVSGSYPYLFEDELWTNDNSFTGLITFSELELTNGILSDEYTINNNLTTPTLDTSVIYTDANGDVISVDKASHWVIVGNVTHTVWGANYVYFSDENGDVVDNNEINISANSEKATITNSAITNFLYAPISYEIYSSGNITFVNDSNTTIADEISNPSSSISVDSENKLITFTVGDTSDYYLTFTYFYNDDNFVLNTDSISVA